MKAFGGEKNMKKKRDDEKYRSNSEENNKTFKVQKRYKRTRK